MHEETSADCSLLCPNQSLFSHKFQVSFQVVQSDCQFRIDALIYHHKLWHKHSSVFPWGCQVLLCLKKLLLQLELMKGLRRLFRDFCYFGILKFENHSTTWKFSCICSFFILQGYVGADLVCVIFSSLLKSVLITCWLLWIPVQHLLAERLSEVEATDLV